MATKNSTKKTTTSAKTSTARTSASAKSKGTRVTPPATKGSQQRFKNRLTGSDGSSNRSSGSKLRWDYGLEPTMKKKSKSRPVDYIPSMGMNADGTPLGGKKR